MQQVTTRFRISFLIAVLAAMLVGVVAFNPSSAHAATTETVSVNVKYCQTEARSMLSMVNEFRSSSDAWYWNSDNSTKTVCSNLSALKYDYKLEKVAMQRAAETAIYWSHTRANGKNTWSAYTDQGCSYGAAGENIAYNNYSASAETAFAQWREDNDNYAGQGHRRSMLSSDFTAIGIGCVYYNGYYFWVQDFNSKTNSLTATTANDTSTNVNVEVSMELVTVTATASPDSVVLFESATANVPSLTTKVSSAKSYAGAVTVNASYSWAIGDTSVATLSGSKVKGVSAGSTNLTTTVLGKSVSVPVTVTKQLTKSMFTVDTAASTYTGSAITKSVSSTSLKSGTDYTVSYANNTNAGTATITITGKGNYSGTLTYNFTINKAASSISLANQTLTYNRSAQAYSGTVTKSGSAGAVTYAYYSDSACKTAVDASKVKDAGIYYVKATLATDTNYNSATSAAAKLTINKANLSSAAIGSIPAQTYTGSAIVPALTVKMGGLALASGTDYTAAYSNNTSAGTAKVTVAGIGNYTGSKSTTFTINKASSSISLADQTLTWNGNSRTYSGTVTKSGSTGAVTYAYYSDSACKTKIDANNVKNAGVYYVKATVAADANYNSATSDAAWLIIAKANMSSAVISSIPAQIYTGSALKPAVTVTLQNGIKLSSGTDYTVAYSNNINVGAGKVTVTGMGNCVGAKSATFAINKASSRISLANQTLIYNGSAQVYSGKVTKSGSTGAVTYAYYSDSACSKAVAASKVKNAGTYYVKGTVAANDNYNGATSSAATLTINKANPSYTTPVGLKGTVGQALSTVKLPSGFTWESPLTVMNTTGTKTYRAKYTPDDTANYNTVNNIAVTVTVSAKQSGGNSGGTTTATKVMYRLYNPNSGEHFYTADALERDHLKRVGWNYEGVGWVAPKSSSTPVYRLYSGTDHHYTTDASEKNYLVKVGWKYEGIGWYSDDAKGVPLYRQYNPYVNPKAKRNNSGSHNYTTSKAENDSLVKVGWRAEGIGWYGVA